MWGGFTWAGAAWASQPQYGNVCQGDGVVFGHDSNAFAVYGGDAVNSGIVFGGEMHVAAIVFGGDTSGGQGIVVGGDEPTGIVFGSDS